MLFNFLFVLEQVLHLILRQLVLSLFRLIVRFQQFSLITGLVFFLENFPKIVHDLSLEFGFFMLSLVLLIAQIQLILIILVIQISRGSRWERTRQHAGLGKAGVYPSSILGCSAVGLLLLLLRPLLATHTAFKLFTKTVIRLFEGLDFIHEGNVLVPHRVILQSCIHVHLAEQVQLLVYLAELFLELEDVLPGMRVQLLELLPGLLQRMLLVRLPSIIVFQLDLGL